MSGKRQIVLDTETTGFSHQRGHRIIEIGCVELIDRKRTGNNYHQYLNPEREIDVYAKKAHGIEREFLADKPLFSEIEQRLMGYLRGAELIIHNVPFDVGFLDAELARVSAKAFKIADVCSVHDTLPQAREMFKSGSNSLDALCQRFKIDNSHRKSHGALIDAELLTDVYLAMTGEL